MRPSRWASSCREPNVPEIWIATDASGRSTAKLATFETASKRIEPALNCVNNSSRRLCRVVWRNERQIGVTFERQPIVDEKTTLVPTLAPAGDSAKTEAPQTETVMLGADPAKR